MPSGIENEAATVYPAAGRAAGPEPLLAAINGACKASACTNGNLVPLSCRLLHKCSVLLLLQFSHFLDQSADARRQGVGADTKAADAARLCTLLSTIGARFY